MSDVLRELSEQSILEAIFRDGPITRPEIAARTGISKPTVSAVVNRLVQAELVQPAGERPSGRGRTPLAFVVNEAAGIVVGVDVGSTTLRVAATDIFGERLAEQEHATAPAGGKAVADQITAVVREIVGRLGPAHGELLAIGLSTPGVVDPVTRRVTSLAYRLSASGGFEALSVLEERFGVPVLVDNDINLAAVGEKWRGLAAGSSTFVFIGIGAGVGMGIVINDELYRGFHGAAGEIGYFPLAADPFAEQHRKLGGLEDEIGADGLVSAYNAGGAGDVTAAREVFERAGAGDERARAVIEAVGQRLGLAIATVCAVLDPALVTLGGRIGSAPDLLPPVRATVARLFPLPIRIETSLLAERAALEGALAMGLQAARERFFSRDRRGPRRLDAT